MSLECFLFFRDFFFLILLSPFPALPFPLYKFLISQAAIAAFFCSCACVCTTELNLNDIRRHFGILIYQQVIGTTGRLGATAPASYSVRKWHQTSSIRTHFLLISVTEMLLSEHFNVSASCQSLSVHFSFPPNSLLCLPVFSSMAVLPFFS